LVDFACEAIHSWTFVCSECLFFITFFISSDQSVKLIYFFLIQFWWAVKSLESCPFLLDCQICWHIMFILFYGFSVFLQYLLRFLLFHFLVYLGFFSPLLGESGQRFVNFKEPALGFIFFSIVFYYFIDFFSDLYDFLPSANFWFCLFFFFLIHLGGRLIF